MGALWYSILFAGVWSRGLQAQGITLPEPTPAQLTVKLALTLVANVAAAVALAWLLTAVGATSVRSALPVGLLVGVGFGGTALGVAYTWESKPVSVYLVDAAYHALGPTVMAVILGAWR
jgi:hypothetical protein